MRIITTLLAAMTIAVLPASAIAEKRDVTDAENQELYQALEDSGHVVTCTYRGYASDTYPTWFFVPHVCLDDGPTDYMYDDITVFERTDTGLVLRYFGAITATRCGRGEAIPFVIGLDLGICDGNNPHGYPYIQRQDKLHFKDFHTSVSEGAHSLITNIRWREWGHSKAIGRGIYDYADLYESFRVPVRITYTEPDQCLSTGFIRFTVRKLTAVRKKDRKRMRAFTHISDVSDSCGRLSRDSLPRFH